MRQFSIASQQCARGCHPIRLFRDGDQVAERDVRAGEVTALIADWASTHNIPPDEATELEREARDAVMRHDTAAGSHDLE